MTNYTTETYQTKRDILNFSNKIGNSVKKVTTKFCNDMIYGILSRHSCKLTSIAKGLNEEVKLGNVIDRLSNRVNNLEYEERQKLEDNYYNSIMKFLPEKEVIVLNDDTDINKEYSKKLEDLCLVRDASSQVERFVKGYKVCEYVALSKKEKQPISLYSKIYSTESKEFKSENDETLKGENKVVETLEKYSRKPIFVRDRGYDSNEYLKNDIKKDINFITRIKGNRNLLFKNKVKNVLEIVKNRKGKIVTKLMYKGENRECTIGYTRVKLPAFPKKEITLVTVHRLGVDYEDEDKDGVLIFLTNLKVTDKESAEHVARLYFLRWRIEEYFKAKKGFEWENSLIRDIQAMNNLNLFLTYAMTYLSMVSDKLKTNFNSNLIIERAKALKKEFKVYLSIVATGIVEILKFARTGIKTWEHIEKREKYKQLALEL